ncbi:MAG: tyrosine-type recombinase/integrase [Leptospiraceae bacterium]|nr:tyrosine-type recombinase/integrase [Leptospiraceae bacterium]
MNNNLAKTDNSIQIPDFNYDDLLERYFKERELSEKSKQTYRINLNQFWTWLIENNKTDLFLKKRLSKIDLLDYKEYLISKELSARTINSYMVSLRQFFAYMVSYDLYPVNPLANIKSVKIESGHSKDELSAKQVLDILRSIERESLIGKRDYAINILKYFCALRDIEVTRALVKDIKTKKGKYILQVQGKGRSATDKAVEFVILTEPVYKAILDYLSFTGRSLNSKGFLFLPHGNKSKENLTTKTIQRIITKPLKELGYKTDLITSHSTRHTAISLAIEAGASLEEAQTLARHKDPKTTQIYIHRKNRFVENAETKIYDLLKGGLHEMKEKGLFE